MSLHRAHLLRLIERSGGAVEDERFVTRPGCLILAETTPTPEAQLLFDELHLDPSRPPYERLGEFNGRLTYLSFPEAPASAAFNEALARRHQHLSVHGPTHVTLLLAGLSVEAAFELCSHREARVARLTTSRTRAMDDPLYRLFGSPEERRWQRDLLRSLLDLRGPLAPSLRDASPDGRELFNRLDTGSRATALTYTMSIKDFHTLFIGRIPEGGNEAEIRDLCSLMCETLAARFPLVIRSPAEYAAMNNGKKYEDAP